MQEFIKMLVLNISILTETCGKYGLGKFNRVTHADLSLIMNEIDRVVSKLHVHLNDISIRE